MEVHANNQRLEALLRALAPDARAAVCSGAPAAAGDVAATQDKPRLCIICTVWYYLTHAQHEGDRFNHGWPMNGSWHHPEVELVSVYCDQKDNTEVHPHYQHLPDDEVPKGDLSAARAEEWGLTVYDSVAEALRCGGEKLAVDCVLLIGEHGQYPVDEYQMTHWPRYEFFTAITDVFKQDGRSVPVFNDKHLSWSWDLAKKMVATSQQLDFPLMAGSGLSVTWRMPSWDLPFGAEVVESLVMGGGWLDGGSYHMIEFTQALLERRAGGETGVLWVDACKGDAAIAALASGSFDAGGVDPALFEACLCRSHSLAQARPGYSARHPDKDEIVALLTREDPDPSHEPVEQPMLFRWKYTDGTCASMLFAGGLVGDYPFAVRVKGQPEPLSTLCYIPPTPNVHYSACLMHCAERMFVTKQPVFPIERTLVATGVNCAGMKALKDGGPVSLEGLESVEYLVTDTPKFAGGGGFLG